MDCLEYTDHSHTVQHVYQQLQNMHWDWNLNTQPVNKIVSFSATLFIVLFWMEFRRSYYAVTWAFVRPSAIRDLYYPVFLVECGLMCFNSTVANYLLFKNFVTKQ